MKVVLFTIALLYAASGIINTLGYVPTMRDLRRKIASANIYTYLIWTFSQAIAFAYASLVVDDFLLKLITGLNFVCCAIIVALAYRLQKADYGKSESDVFMGDPLPIEVGEEHLLKPHAEEQDANITT
jgi:hypothetical protein